VSIFSISVRHSGICLRNCQFMYSCFRSAFFIRSAETFLPGTNIFTGPFGGKISLIVRAAKSIAA